MATSAVETAKQENGSRVFFESVIEKNTEPCDHVGVSGLTKICISVKNGAKSSKGKWHCTCRDSLNFIWM